LYAGFSKIGTVSSDMSQRKGSLERVQGQSGVWWKLNFNFQLSFESNSVSAWTSGMQQVWTSVWSRVVDFADPPQIVLITAVTVAKNVH
jgi:hypothetical protein